MKRFILFAILGSLFISVSIVYDQERSKTLDVVKVAEQVSLKFLRKSEQLSSNAESIKNDSTISWSSISNGFYLFDGDALLKWNKSDLVIKSSELLAAVDSSIVKISKSKVFIRKWKWSDGRVLVGIVPIVTEYRIVNQYIQPWINSEIFPEGCRVLDQSSESGVSVCLKKNCLFKIALDPLMENEFSFIAAIVGILLLVISIFFFVEHLHKRKKYFLAFATLFGSLAILRIATVELSFPSRWIISDYFSPAYFASSSFNSSLIDFFLNALIVAVSCGYLFWIHAKLTFHRLILPKSGLLRLLLSATFLTLAFFSFLFPYLFVESIFHDSKIVFDLSENIDFNGIRVLATAAVMLGCISSFFFVHIWVRWSIHMAENVKNFLISLLVAVVVFISYAVYSEHNYWITTSLGGLYILYLYFSGFYRSFSLFGYRSIPYLLVPVMLFSIQTSLANWHFSEERKAKAMVRFASSTLDRDVLGEYLLNDAVREIAKDPFIQLSMSNPLLSKQSVRDKIREKYLISYFDRYHFQIALFKRDGFPADPLTSVDLASSVKSFVNQTNQTQYKDIYFVRGDTRESLIRYLAVVKLSPEAGYIILDLSLKRVIPKLTLPELVVDNRFALAFENKDFSFAFYQGRLLLGSFGSYNFEKKITPSDYVTTAQNVLHQNGYSLISLLDENNRRIVVATPSYSWFMALANFSLFFILGVSVLFIAIAGFFMKELSKGISISYTARIQSYAYLAFILPLVAVSVMAFRMINQSNRNQVLEANIDRGNAISSEISELIGQNNSLSDVAIRNYAIEMARTFSIDLNIYGLDGNMMATSSPEVVEEGLVSNIVNREAWEKIIQRQLNGCSLTKRIGLLEYTSLFSPIRSNVTGRLMGILELPFIRSDAFIAKSKVNVMANILVIFTGVFLLFTVLTIVSINSFTWPFRLMARTLKSTQIEGNELMKWNSNDEIGLMVKEYNQMVLNLEKSKLSLEKSERESAWREIAQQVAHEIKNPLTPIKLTLQQLEQALPNGVDSQKMERSVKTLLTQVETLNEIASAFSSFAKMPSPNIQTINVGGLLKEIVSLYMHLPNRKAELIYSSSFWVKADPKLLAGVFSNILLNAYQSRQESDPVSVVIDIIHQNKMCVISFKDDGPGIEEELRNKIFLPHFSTKQSGSGLGLAISKQATESMGGKIAFKSEAGFGSVFFVELVAASDQRQ